MDHFPWEGPTDAGAATTAAPAGGTSPEDETAVGHKRDLPAQAVVTTAISSVGPEPAEVKPAPWRAPPNARHRLRILREQVTMGQVLEHLGAFAGMGGRGRRRRGPCPVHGTAGDGGRAFSENLDKNIFQCFNAGCGLKGNVLDLWAAVHRLPTYEAALHLAGTFHLALNREEEPVMGTRRPRSAAGSRPRPRIGPDWCDRLTGVPVRMFTYYYVIMFTRMARGGRGTGAG